MPQHVIIIFATLNGGGPTHINAVFVPLEGHKSSAAVTSICSIYSGRECMHGTCAVCLALPQTSTNLDGVRMRMIV